MLIKVKLSGNWEEKLELAIQTVLFLWLLKHALFVHLPENTAVLLCSGSYGHRPMPSSWLFVHTSFPTIWNFVILSELCLFIQNCIIFIYQIFRIRIKWKTIIKWHKRPLRLRWLGFGISFITAIEWKQKLQRAKLSSVLLNAKWFLCIMVLG